MRQKGDKSYRSRAGVVVVDTEKKQVLFIFRRRQTFLSEIQQKKQEEFYIPPAGGIEKDETPEQAALRELKEETNLTVDKLDKKLFEVRYPNCTEHYFLATDFYGEAKLGKEEIERTTDDNFYRLDWISLKDLDKLSIQVFPIAVVHFLRQEFQL